MPAANLSREAFDAPDPWNVFGGGTPLAAFRSEPFSTGMPSSWKQVRQKASGMKRIGEILVDAGVISTRIRDRVLEHQRWKGVSFGTALLEVGVLSEKLLLRALSVQTSAPGASAADLASIPPEILALVSRRIVERYSVIPFRKAGRELHLAMAQPNDNPAIRTVARLTGCTVVPNVAIAARVVLAIEKHYGVSAAPHFTALAKVLDEMPAEAAAEAPATPAPPVRPDPTPATEATQAPLPWSELILALSEARDLDQVATELVDVLKEPLGPIAIFLVHGDAVDLWRSHPAPAAPPPGLSIPLSASSLFASLREGGAAFAGPCPDTRANRQIVASVGGCLPGSVVVVPVTLCERTVLYVVARPDGGCPPLHQSDLGKLANITSTALEYLEARRRLLSL